MEEGIAPLSPSHSGYQPRVEEVGGGGCIDKKVPVVRNFTSQCRVSYYLDGTGSAVLEANTVEALVEVDGVLPRHNLSYN